MAFGNVPKDYSYTSIKAERALADKSVTGFFAGKLLQNGNLLQVERSPENWVTASPIRLPVTQVSKLPSGVGAAGQIGTKQIAVNEDGSLLAHTRQNLNCDIYSVTNNVPALVTSLLPTGSIGTNGPPSCDMSADGKTVVYGLFPNNGAWVFTNVAGTWEQTTPKLLGVDSRFMVGAMGQNVAMSADGKTIAISAPTSGPGVGQAVGVIFVYTLSETGTWSQQGQGLVGIGYEGTATSNGLYMAMSRDGNTIASVGPAVDKTWVFSRNEAGVWAQVGTALDFPISNYTYSVGVTLSDDGAVLGLSGVSNDLASIPAVCLLQRKGSEYELFQTIEMPRNNIDGQNFYLQLSSLGSYLSLSSDETNNYEGAVWLYSKNAKSQYEYNSQVKPKQSVRRFGSQVAISQDEKLLGVFLVQDGVNENVYLFR